MIYGVKASRVAKRQVVQSFLFAWLLTCRCGCTSFAVSSRLCSVFKAHQTTTQSKFSTRSNIGTKRLHDPVCLCLKLLTGVVMLKKVSARKKRRRTQQSKRMGFIYHLMTDHLRLVRMQQIIKDMLACSSQLFSTIKLVHTTVFSDQDENESKRKWKTKSNFVVKVIIFMPTK